MRFRETQSQWFGKRGISWHFSAVIHLANHPDCQCTTTSMNGFKIHTYIVVLDSCKQDWFAVSCILEEVLSVVKASHPTVTQAKVRSDNAGCYHCTALLTTINNSSNGSGIEVKRYDFSEPQAGKDLCDRKIAPCKQRLRNYVSENHNMPVTSRKAWSHHLLWIVLEEPFAKSTRAKYALVLQTIRLLVS